MNSLKIAIMLSAISLAWISNSPAAENEFASADELGLMQGFPPPPDKRVDRSNALFTAPFNRWSYLNMRQLYPTASIPNAAIPIPVNRVIVGGIGDLDVRREDGTVAHFNRYLRETYTDAFVVVKGNEIVYEAYFNGMHRDHPHQMMSVTKSFAGLFGLLAVSEGLLKERDPVSKYVPELEKSGAFGGATVGQVLDMTNALDFSEDYADPMSGIVQYSKVMGFMQAAPEDIVADNIYDFLVMQPKDPEHDHGDVFHYQTPKTDVVNWVTNRATGLSFQDNFYEKLWSKLGTDGETYVLLDSNGTLFAGGGLNATPTDLARFAIMMINEGEFHGRQVISPDVIDALAKGASTEAFSDGPSAEGVMGNGDWSYRAQWWVRHTEGKESFSAIGIHGQWIYIDVERDVAIIKQSSQPVSDANEFDEFNINAFDAIIEYLTK